MNKKYLYFYDDSAASMDKVGYVLSVYMLTLMNVALPHNTVETVILIVVFYIKEICAMR